jgi:hypothetical protein
MTAPEVFPDDWCWHCVKTVSSSGVRRPLVQTVTEYGTSDGTTRFPYDSAFFQRAILCRACAGEMAKERAARDRVTTVHQVGCCLALAVCLAIDPMLALFVAALLSLPRLWD